MSVNTLTSKTQATDPSQVNVSSSVASKKITLGKALVIATLAIAAIALLYLEVKYRIVSTGIVYAMTNPWVMGVIGVVAILGIAYLIYRNMKSPSTNTISESSMNPSPALLALATEEDLSTALAADSTLDVFFRGQYSFTENETELGWERAEITRVLTFDEASRRVERRFGYMQRFAIDTAGYMQPGASNPILEKLISTRSLALRWLMSPRCLERS